MLRVLATVAILLSLSACVPAGAQELQIISKGGPPVSVEINGARVVGVPCNGGVVLRPGSDGAPPLPWNVKVTDESKRRVVLDQRIAELPRWLVIFSDSAGISASPVLGPVLPCPAP